MKDSVVLENFVKCIKYNGKIYTRKNKQGHFGCSVNICCDEFIKNLKRFNITPRKSLTYTFPKWLISHPMANHFMRGYFDGDGSFSQSKTNNRIRPTMMFNLCGTKEFLKIYRRVLCKNCDINNRVKIHYNKSAGNIYYLSYCGNQNIIKIRNFLYHDSNNLLLLKRKKDLVYNSWIDK